MKEDPLEFPDFLCMSQEERNEAWRTNPPTAAPVRVVTKRGKYPPHWYDDPGTRRLIQGELMKKYGDQNVRYQIFWVKEKGGRRNFVGYHDGQHPTAKPDPELSSGSMTHFGEDEPVVDHPINGKSFDKMPAGAVIPPRGSQRGEIAARETKPVPALIDGRPAGKRPRASGGGTRLDRFAAALPAASRITIAKPHGRKPGTGKYERAEAVVAGKGGTVEAYLAAGGNPETLTNAVKEGWARLEQ